MNGPIKYRFYATLLNAFADYLQSAELWRRYYGDSAAPKLSEEEFSRQQFGELIDRINRVPFESEAADEGTAFNEVIDCLIEHRKSEEMKIEAFPEYDNILVEYKRRIFGFPISLCRRIARYFAGALTQVRTEAVLPTRYGNVLLYGVVDELMPFSVHDLKKTKHYYAGKFRPYWQHVVYPYCLNAEGNEVYDFEYNILEGKANTFTEYYRYRPERDIPRLREHCEWLIEFLEANRDKITDKKIFNL